MRVRDLSAGGISFELAHELPGLDVGTNLDKVTLRLGPDAVRGDIVVMRISQRREGAICGGIFYPSSDEDAVALDRVMEGLRD